MGQVKQAMCDKADQIKAEVVKNMKRLLKKGPLETEGTLRERLWEEVEYYYELMSREQPKGMLLLVLETMLEDDKVEKLCLELKTKYRFNFMSEFKKAKKHYAELYSQRSAV